VDKIPDKLLLPMKFLENSETRSEDNMRSLGIVFCLSVNKAGNRGDKEHVLSE
jgi:hypothetical protein